MELHAIFKGRVQGVGFRWTVVDYAERFQLTGITKNLNNGSVEVYAQGSKEKLEQFVEAVKNDPGLAKIDSVSCEYRQATQPFQGFRIVY